jgi:ribosomal protein S18 acetylase RimI-like enzyme
VKRSRLCRAADRNAAEAIRHFARHADGATLTESTSSLLVASSTAYPGAWHNAAMPVGPDVDYAAVLAEARVFEAAHRRNLVLWTASHWSTDLAHVADLRHRSAVVGMATDMPPPQVAVPSDVELVRVTDSEGVAAFEAVHTQVFRDAGQPPEAVAHFASSRILLAPNVTAFVALVKGRALSCAMVINTGREAGIYWVATHPDARNRGLGSLVTRAVTRAGFEQGANIVVLQATPSGAAVYRRIGFTDFTIYDRYMRNDITVDR